MRVGKNGWKAPKVSWEYLGLELTLSHFAIVANEGSGLGFPNLQIFHDPGDVFFQESPTPYMLQ